MGLVDAMDTKKSIRILFLKLGGRYTVSMIEGIMAAWMGQGEGPVIKESSL